MKNVKYTTQWGKVLYGKQYGGFEFVDELKDNKNANWILVDDEENRIIFLLSEFKYCAFTVNDLESITQYAEEDADVWNFYYQVKTKNGISEFSNSTRAKV